MSFERIKDKINEIQNYLEEFDNIIPENYKEYKNSFLVKAACERYFEKIVETVVDVAYLFIKTERFSLPEEDIKAFDILVDKEIISNELGEKIKDAKGMRNILAHEYGKVDDELVFESITKEIFKDTEEFINQIEYYFIKKEAK